MNCSISVVADCKSLYYFAADCKSAATDSNGHSSSFYIYILTKSAKVEFWGCFLTFLFFSLLYKYTFLTSFLTSVGELNTILTLFNVYKVEAYIHCLLHPSVGFNDCFFLATHCHQAKHCEKCYGFYLFFHNCTNYFFLLLYNSLVLLLIIK